MCSMASALPGLGSNRRRFGISLPRKQESTPSPAQASTSTSMDWGRIVFFQEASICELACSRAIRSGKTRSPLSHQVGIFDFACLYKEACSTKAAFSIPMKTGFLNGSLRHSSSDNSLQNARISLFKRLNSK